MNHFTKLEFRSYSFDNLYSFTESRIYCTATLKDANPNNQLYYWYAWVIDGKQTVVQKSYIYRPSLTNSLNLTLFTLGESINNIKLRVWEVDPSTNENAEYIDSNTQENVKVTKLLTSPKISCNLDYDSTDKTLTYIYLNYNSFLNYFDINKLKIYELETGFVLYEGVPTYQPDKIRFPVTLIKPQKGVVLKTIIAEWVLKDIKTSMIFTTKSACASSIRFDYGAKSKVTDFFPFRTHNGNRVTKYPIYNIDSNSYIYFNVTKTAVLNLNYTETDPGSFLENDYATVHTDYWNETKNAQTNSSAYLYLSNTPSANFESEREDINLSSNNVNEGIVSNGDIIIPKMKIDYGNETIERDKEPLTATLCLVNNRELSELKLVSMPPIYLDDAVYEIELFKSDNDFIPFGTVSSNFGYGEPLRFTTNKILLNLSDISYPNDFYISMSMVSVWYPDINTIDNMYNSMSSEAQIRPLITTKKESLFIQSDVSPIFGQPLTLSAVVENLVQINIGSNNFVWKKDGVVINTSSPFLTFDAVTPDDNGVYTLEYTVKPKGIQADDSSIKMVSQEFTLDVKSQNSLSMTVSINPANIVPGEIMLVNGEITIETNTISKLELYRDNTLVESYDTGNMIPQYTADTASETDAGVYQFRITYLDGNIERNFYSDTVTAIYDNRPPIDFTVDFTTPVVNDGEQATLVGKVTNTNPPTGISYLYQWHRKDSGAIIGENDKDYVMESANANDTGEYWLSVLATSPTNSSTLKTSPRHTFVVRQDGQLKFNITADANVVADGKPAKLSMSYGANQQVSPTWDWYANGELIPNSSNKPTIEHIGYGDVIYYVLGKPTAPNVIPNFSQSNLINVRGVVAVEDLNLEIIGPNKAKLGERILLTSIISESDHHSGSNNLSPDDYTIEWYRGNERVGTGKELRLYVASDIAGDYTYKIYSKVDPTINRTSPVHKFTIDNGETPTMSVTLPVAKNIKTGQKLTITPNISPEPVGQVIYQWMKNGQDINNAQGKSREYVIDSATTLDSGVYTLSVTVDSTPTISTPCVVKVSEDIDPPEPIQGDWYIHDLNPGRNHGFTWIGWWALDEILKANNDHFDWVSDPTNPRFKYQNVIKALADNKNTWEDIEIQESRNGRIILFSEIKYIAN